MESSEDKRQSVEDRVNGSGLAELSEGRFLRYRCRIGDKVARSPPSLSLSRVPCLPSCRRKPHSLNPLSTASVLVLLLVVLPH